MEKIKLYLQIIGLRIKLFYLNYAFLVDSVIFGLAFSVITTLLGGSVPVFLTLYTLGLVVYVAVRDYILPSSRGTKF